MIELLVAVAVFAVMAALAYGGLTSILDARAQTRAAAEDLARLQIAVSLMSRDLQQAVPRAVRGNAGDRLPALTGHAGRIELTRTGHANPTGLKRATLERLAWSVEAGELTRWSWPVLDRARATTPRGRALLDDVAALRWRFYDRGQWYETWPPRKASRPLQAWPDAVEFNLLTQDGGQFTRLIPLVSPRES